MFLIAICEDERNILEKLHEEVERYIKDRYLTADIKLYTSGEDLLNANLIFDIILLDLVLPGISGLETARHFSGKSRIVFITSYQEYAVDAFELEAVHYLLKPVTEKRLYLALDRAVKRTDQMDNKALALTKAGKIQVVCIRDIIYCEVFDHQVCIHSVQGNYDYSGTLDTLEKELDERFFRCHRSYIINMNYVVSQEKGVAVVSNGERILISRRKQQEFMQMLLRFLKREVM